MSKLDLILLAEKVATVERHLARVAARLPSDPQDLAPGTDACDAVVLHLWQAVQITIDLAMAMSVQLHLGTPGGYADAFRRLARAGVVDPVLAERLAKAAGLRNVIAHAYEDLDLLRVHAAAIHGPADLRAFLAAVRDRLA